MKRLLSASEGCEGGAHLCGESPNATSVHLVGAGQLSERVNSTELKPLEFLTRPGTLCGFHTSVSMDERMPHGWYEKSLKTDKATFTWHNVPSTFLPSLRAGTTKDVSCKTRLSQWHPIARHEATLWASVKFAFEKDCEVRLQMDRPLFIASSQRLRSDTIRMKNRRVNASAQSRLQLRTHPHTTRR